MPTALRSGFAVGLYLLYNRGVPDAGEMGAEMRPPKPKPLLKAVGINLLSAMIGATIGQFFFPILARLFGFVTQELLIGLGTSFGFFTAALTEIFTGKSFTTQLAYNLSHGVSFTIAALVIAGTLAPMIMADPKETPYQGTGFARWRPEPRAKAGRQYLCDPRAIDTTGLPGRDTPLGRVGFGATAETWNGRAAMVGLMLTFLIEGATHHGIFRG